MDSTFDSRRLALLLLGGVLLHVGMPGTGRANTRPFDLPAYAVDAGAGASEVHVGDVDGDGLEDVVLVKEESGGLIPAGVAGAIVVRYGEPGGGFGPQVSSAGAGPPRQASLADTNGDGADEIVAFHSPSPSVASQEIKVWRVQPDRSLAVVASISTAPSTIRAVAAGDFDGDGDGDIAWYAGNLVSILRSNGDDTFTPVLSVAMGQNFFGGDRLVTGDFNGDGRTDLACNGNAVSALVFGGPAFDYSKRTSSVGNSLDIVAADLDGNGADDLINVRATLLPNDDVAGRTVQLLRGDTFATYATLTTTGDIRCAAAGDVDGDGLPDVLTGDRVLRTIAWNRNLGNWSYEPAGTWPAGGTPKRMAWIDLDEDGVVDPIVASTGGLTVVGVLSGQEAFHPPGAIATSAAPTKIEPGDFDGDGGRDFAVLNSSPAAVTVHRRGPGGTWSRTDLPLTGIGRDLAVSDLDADGASDFVALLGGGTPRVVVCRGDGAGGFHAPVEFLAPGALTMGVADLDGDGDLDVLALAPNLSRAWPLLGDGNGGFVAATDFAVPAGVQDFVMLDLNGDTRLDLVTADGTAQTVSILHGSGPGLAFDAPVPFPIPGAADVIQKIDANQDGQLDVVVAGTPGPLCVFLNQGPDTFTSPIVTTGPGPNLADLRVSYLDGDVRQDLIALTSFASSGTGGCVHLLRGAGDGTFAYDGAWYTGHDPGGFAFTDVTLDAAPDILVTQGDGTVLVLANQVPGVVGVPPVLDTQGTTLALRVSPSPASGPFRIEFAGRPLARIRVEILSVDGRRVNQAREVLTGADGHATLFAPAPRRAGVYFVRVTQDDRQVVKRVVAVN